MPGIFKYGLELPLALAVALAFTAGGCGAPPPAALDLTLVHERPLAAPAEEAMAHLVFTTPAGDTIEAVLRYPIDAGSIGGVVLVAGRETGREAAVLIPGPLDAAVLAIEYPDAIPEDLDPRAALRALPSIRRTALRMPRILLGATDYLTDVESVDEARILLVGVSFGVPFAAAAGRDERYAGIGLLHGGANLRLLLQENLPGPAWRRALLARFGAWYLRRLEPRRHIPHIAPRPLLLINGIHDEMIPRAAAEALRESARGPVHQIWLPHGHLMPGDHDLMRELADSTARHFSEIVYGAQDRPGS